MSKNIYKKPKKGPGSTLTTEEFIERAKKVHGSKYDYSKVIYKNANTKVIIICPVHGEFLQTGYSHYCGKGCPKCGRILCESKFRSTSKEFIKKARKVHGSKYDYSKIDYKNSGTKVTIICPEHGEFKQTPTCHLAHQGCPKCGIILNTQKRSLNTKTFIKRSKVVHGNKYDYSKVAYKNNGTKVTIICPIHGEFKQRASHHLSGGGCSKCHKPRFDRSRDDQPGCLYLITCKSKSESFCKIGTAYVPEQRFEVFPFKIIKKLIIHGKTGPLFLMEQSIIHGTNFKKYKYKPKTKFGGSTECFSTKAFAIIKKYLLSKKF